MVSTTMRYVGELRCEAVHGPSGTAMETDAPTDNHGKGARFSPTDLIGTALGTCILTTMAIFADRLGLALDGASATVEKQMVIKSVRRIGRLAVGITMPPGILPEHQEKLESAALHCPVHQSLHPEVELVISFDWGG